MTPRGRLFALEGIDGAGTTTQARLLADGLAAQGRAVHLTCEPSRGPIGALLRQVLGHAVRAVDRASLALLFAADRVDHLRDEVEPRLGQGVDVVSDRYVYSSLAYQSMDLAPEWVAEINRLAPEADLTVYLRVDPDEAARRRADRGSVEIFETTPEQIRIASLYDDFFGSAPGDGSWIPDPGGSGWIRQDPPGSRPLLARVGRQPAWVVIDGAQPIDEIQRQLRKLAREICPRPQLWQSA